MVWILLACAEPALEDSVVESDTDADSDTDTDADSDSDSDTDPHEIGRELPPFDLLDLNPASATYEQVVSSQDQPGTYALVFLDSRCLTCAEVAIDLWAEYELHPEWDLPTLAVQSVYGGGEAADIEHMVGEHGLPYLLDTEEVALWSTYRALNHDFYVVGPDGRLEAWLPLYTWPEDKELFDAFMAERYADEPD